MGYFQSTPSSAIHSTLYLSIYTDNKVKLSVYPYKRMGIVSTASHSVVSFHGIPLFLFSSLILSSKPHICTSKQVKFVKSSLSLNPQIIPNPLFTELTTNNWKSITSKYVNCYGIETLYYDCLVNPSVSYYSLKELYVGNNVSIVNAVSTTTVSMSLPMSK